VCKLGRRGVQIGASRCAFTIFPNPQNHGSSGLEVLEKNGTASKDIKDIKMRTCMQFKKTA